MDYGSTYTVSKECLLSLPESVMVFEAQAVICRLADIEPVDEDWSDEAKDFFIGHCKYFETCHSSE